ncbi:MAG: hypothetical protein IKV53_03555 [Clostridia bacterium]|nr:hypothetical protein [Clostridia bacterium]
MIKKTSFVKMDRGIRDCDWYRDGATVRVFNELLMTANVKPCEFEGITVGRGQRAVSVDTLSEKLALDTEEVRRALNKLYKLGELKAERHPSFSLVTVVHYDYYQGYYDSPEPVTCEAEREANEYANKMFWDAVKRTRRKGRKME